MIDSFHAFVKDLYGYDESVNTCVLGPNETGKTDFNLLIMQTIYDLGISKHFGSNLKDLSADFEIQHITDFETLKKTCKMLNPNPAKYGLKKFVFFGSEIAKWASRDTAWLNTDLIKELQTVRKYGLCFLTDAIDRVDKRILNPRFFAGEFQKPFKRNKKFAIYKDYSNHSITRFTDIPKTQIEFNTYEEAEFFMKPQNPDKASIPLNYEHEIVKKYMDLGSWAKVGVHRQEGKRCLLKVLGYHFTHCLTLPTKEIVELSTTEETEITVS